MMYDFDDAPSPGELAADAFEDRLVEYAAEAGLDLDDPEQRDQAEESLSLAEADPYAVRGLSRADFH